jgi:hypothetical protein
MTIRGGEEEQGLFNANGGKEVDAERDILEHPGAGLTSWSILGLATAGLTSWSSPQSWPPQRWSYFCF